jgi:uncharacterized membrane protein YphA (DoxX/SURF4 family)
MNMFTKILNNSWIELAARWLLGMVFVYASYHKILSPAYFAKVIYGYHLFPDFSINILAIVLPFLELSAGLALILGIYPRSAALILNVLLLAFMVALSINLMRGLEFDCGCFSFDEAGAAHSAWHMLARDAILFALGVQVLVFDNYRRGCLRQSGSILNNISA